MPKHADDDAVTLTVAGREVRISHPDKPYFSRGVQLSKLQLAQYYLAVADAAVRGIADRPLVLKRFVDGAHEPAFYQKRAPSSRPAWLRTTTISFPSGRSAEEVVVDDAAGLLWVVNLGCIELHPHAVRTRELEHPDELRIDLDPSPGSSWQDVLRVALEVKQLLDELGLRSFPKTSGSRGMHVYARIEPRWSFSEVRRAALALAREIERRAPAIASSKWWKEERHGVFLDYNQNAKDRTTCSAYSVRPTADARVSMPLPWREVEACDPADFTVATVPALLKQHGDAAAEIDAHAGSLEPLLALAARDEANGLGDAPWPPHFQKAAGEGPRVAPSRAKRAASGEKPKRVKQPLIVVANSPDKEGALAGLERWREKNPEAAALLQVDDVLVDTMRGRFSTWTRVRVNLRNVPEAQRPAQATPDPDYDPRSEWAAARERAERGEARPKRTRKPKAT